MKALVESADFTNVFITKLSACSWHRGWGDLLSSLVHVVLQSRAMAGIHSGQCSVDCGNCVCGVDCLPKALSSFVVVKRREIFWVKMSSSSSRAPSPAQQDGTGVPPAAVVVVTPESCSKSTYSDMAAKTVENIRKLQENVSGGSGNLGNEKTTIWVGNYQVTSSTR